MNEVKLGIMQNKRRAVNHWNNNNTVNSPAFQIWKTHMHEMDAILLCVGINYGNVAVLCYIPNKTQYSGHIVTIA